MAKVISVSEVSTNVRVTDTDFGGIVGNIPTVVLVDPTTGMPYSGAAPVGSRSIVSFFRPANVTPYTAGDVVGGVLTFAAVGPAASHLMLTSVDLRYDVAAIPVGMTNFRLHLYSATPPSALTDNTPWDLPAGDRNAYIGFVDLGTIADLGLTLFAQADQVNKHVQMGVGETALYAYLVTIGGYTPASAVLNSENVRLTLRDVAL